MNKGKPQLSPPFALGREKTFRKEESRMWTPRRDRALLSFETRCSIAGQVLPLWSFPTVLAAHLTDHLLDAVGNSTQARQFPHGRPPISSSSFSFSFSPVLGGDPTGDHSGTSLPGGGACTRHVRVTTIPILGTEPPPPPGLPKPQRRIDPSFVSSSNHRRPAIEPTDIGLEAAVPCVGSMKRS